MFYFCSKEKECWEMEYFIYGVKMGISVRGEMDRGGCGR